MEDLLSIKEAARLMGVCENTLRDWDIEKKFTAIRTAGGHRRYSLTAIREYLDKNVIPKSSSPMIQTLNSDVTLIRSSGKELKEKWGETEYLKDVSENQQTNLAVLLENCQCHKNLSITNDPLFSTSQSLWLTAEAWKRMKFKNMIGIQCMSSPLAYGYSLHQNSKGGKTLSSDPVASVTNKYDFTLFENANFDNVKELYANALALELDLMIFNKLYETQKIDVSIENPRSDLIQFNSSSKPDFVVAPYVIIEQLKPKLNNIDFYEIPAMLTPETFKYMAIAGNYVTDKFHTPSFHPYMIIMESGCTSATSVRAAINRIGWMGKK